tara:strand:- start:139 stop:279 length:141 start_codon:yes stop_codon:yes gene_type:complete
LRHEATFKKATIAKSEMGIEKLLITEKVYIAIIPTPCSLETFFFKV